MNLHETVIGKGRGAKMNKGFKPGFMGPPLRLPPRKKTSTSSSSLNWGKSQTSIVNSSSIFRSGGSSKSSTDDSECRIILALTEGRGDARCEVGLASLNVPRATLVLCQISDTPSYINTLTKINILNPCELIIPATFADNSNKARLMDLIKQHFPVMRIVMFPRSSYNKSNGIERLQYLCLPEFKSLLLSLHYKYYALCAASAAFIYAQNTLNVYYAADTLKLDYQESEGFAVIDVWTADRLELVSSTRPAQATKYSTLFGVLNNCMTKTGSRTLRSTILQPPCLPSIIEERLKCVTELIESPEMMLSIKIILQKVSNIDQLLTITTMFPNDAQHCSYRQLNYLLMLNSVLDHIEPLRDVFNKAQQPFFIELRELLSSNDFNTLRDLVREMIHKDAHYAKGQAGDMQRCFIIKPGVNGLLDSVRKIYSERIEAAVAYVKQLADKYNLPLTLGNNNSKGYHIVLALKGQQKRYLKKSDLPGEFIQVFRLAGSFTMKTLELINLSTRIDNVMMDIIKLSNLMIYKLLAGVKKYIGLFYRLCEGISNLDMYQSLAQVSSGAGYAKPIFGDYTDVRFSRHPMLEYLCSTRPVANSFASCNYFNFHIITGPNGSGKSVFIRQIALLQVMAQVGCYIPAEFAHFKPADRIYARVYLEDNMECGASAFTLEMKEIKYIMTTMTAHSLIIIDELCRSTSVEEGTALAMAICEKLCSTSAVVYVTTHYTLLTKLQQMYYNIKIWQMETEAFGDKPENTVLDFKYTVQPGVTRLERYGVYMVRNIWPVCLVKQIDKMIDEIRLAPKTANFMGLDDKLRLKYELEATFSRLKSDGKLTKAKINTHLNTYISELEKMDVCLALRTSTEDSNEDFISNLQSNCVLSQMSALDSLPEFSVHGDWDPALAEEMLQNFTPNISEQLSLNSSESGAVKQNRFFEPFIYNESVSYDSNYRHLSEFIGENSENINKLVPEVILKSPSRSEIVGQQSFCLDFTHIQEPNREDPLEMMTVLSDVMVSPCRSDQSYPRIRDQALQQQYEQRQPFRLSGHSVCVDSSDYAKVNNNHEFSAELFQVDSSIRFNNNQDFSTELFQVDSSRRFNNNQDFSKELFQVDSSRRSPKSYSSQFLNVNNYSSCDQPSSSMLNVNILDKTISATSANKQLYERSSSEEIMTSKCNFGGSCITNDVFCNKINEAIEELNSCSESFFEDDMEFDTDSSYRSAISEDTLRTLDVSHTKPSDTVNRDNSEIFNRNNADITNQDQIFIAEESITVRKAQKDDDNQILQHIFPKVIIREGRNDTSKSFGQEESDDEEYCSALETEENNMKNESTIPLSKLWNFPIKNYPNMATKDLDHNKYEQMQFCNEEINENSESDNMSYHSIVADFDKSLNMAEEIPENTLNEHKEIESASSNDNNKNVERSNIIEICSSTATSNSKKSDLVIQSDNNDKHDGKDISKKTLQSCSPKSTTDSFSYMIECCNTTKCNQESTNNTLSLQEDTIVSSNKSEGESNSNDVINSQPIEYIDHHETNSSTRGNIRSSTITSDTKTPDLAIQSDNNDKHDGIDIFKKSLQSCSAKSITDNSSSYIIECGNSTESNQEFVNHTMSLQEDTNVSSNKSEGNDTINSQPNERIGGNEANSEHTTIKSCKITKKIKRNKKKNMKKTTNKFDVITAYSVSEENENNSSCQKIEHIDDISNQDEIMDRSILEAPKDKSSFGSIKSEVLNDNRCTTYNDETTQTKQTKKSTENYNLNNNGSSESLSEHEDTKSVTNKINCLITTTNYIQANKSEPSIHEADLFSESSLPSQNNETIKHSTSTSSIKESTSSPDLVGRKESSSVKRKFKPPRPIDNSSTATDDMPCRPKSKRLRPTSRFVPPKKLTKREIIEELDKQNRILIEEAEKNPDESSKYLKKWLNTPSVSQIQNATILTHIRKTEGGIIELPTATMEKPQRKVKLLPSLRSASSERCDISIFSDKNAIPFEEFLKSKEKDYKLFNFDFTKNSNFKFLPSQCFDGVQSHMAASLPLKRSSYNLTVENVQLLTEQNQLSREISAANFSLTPDGYYKKNKPEIETLIDKYARRDDYENMLPVSIPSQRKSIFEDTASGEFNL